MSLPDLVQAKKTQQTKDWPMIARLVEANYFQNRDHPTPEQVAFWLRELRTSQHLVDVARRFPAECRQELVHRELLALARVGDEAGLETALETEQHREREADRVYWAPLNQEPERLRRRGAGGA